jgi:hypothetical protein
VGHWPEHLADKSRCKLCIKSYSRMKCGKCNVALCLNKWNNCFKDFHVKWLESYHTKTSKCFLNILLSEKLQD